MQKKSLWLMALLLCVSSPLFAAQIFQATYTQDFESASEFGLPTGWTQANTTDPNEGSFVAGETTSLGKSSELEGWTVLTIDKLKLVGGGRDSNPNVISGKSVYAESDTRDGVQRQYLYTPTWDLRTLKNVQIHFDSNFVQNQDSLAFAEYTLQGNLKNDDANKKWLPIFYWMNGAEVEAAAGDVQLLMDSNGLNDDSNEPYSYYITTDVASISMTDNVQGRKDDDKVTDKKSESFTLPKAAGQQYVQIRFFQGGGGSWYWGIDNFAIGSMIEGELPKNPATPVLSVQPAKPVITDKITLSGSAYSSPANVEFAKAVWEIAIDKEFKKIAFSANTTDLSPVEIPASNIPVGLTLYARVKYTDKNTISSEYSTSLEFQVAQGTGLVKIFSEDFESTEIGKVPAGWTMVNLSDVSGDPVLAELTAWGVHAAEEYPNMPDGGDRVTVPAMNNGKSCMANSDGYGPYQEAHLITPPINLTGVKNVYLTFSSNYEQNQDNIGVLEYSTDGGSVDESGNPTGTWQPIAYLICSKSIVLNDAGVMDAEATLLGVGDGLIKSYGEYAFASQKMQPADLAPYISARFDDDAVGSKLFEKYRLPLADGKANVKVRWVNTGTNSWYWGIDDLFIWGDNGADVNEWSLF